MIRHLSLFSGIESFKKALDNLGIENELVGYSEIDKYASLALSAIHGVSEDLNYGDITKIDETQLPDCDLITYGFPCQDISVAGLGKGIVEGETRSGLLYDALRIIKYKKPKYAIAENVKNLVGKRFRGDFDNLLLELESYGYNNYWQVLNAKDYGVPQNRERVFIVSIRKDIDDGYDFPTQGISNIKLEDILEDNVSDSLYYKNDSREYLNYDKSKVNKNICPINPIQVGNSLEFGNSVKNEPIAYTLRASNPNGILNEDWKIRKFTPRESFRLMGFADEDYNKLELISDTQKYKQAGNSIVVQVVEGIFKNLLI